MTEDDLGEMAKHHARGLTNADKRRRVEELLRDPKWAGMSDRAVAAEAGLGPWSGHKLVAAVRRTVGADSPTMRVGRDGVAQPAVKRPAPPPAASPAIVPPPPAPEPVPVPAAADPPPEPAVADPLTQKILAWRACGGANADIARALGIAETAVSAVVRSIMPPGKRVTVNPSQARRVAELAAAMSGLSAVSSTLIPELMDEATRRALVTGWSKLNGTLGAIARSMKSGKS